jgi:hypothetical protein
MLQKHRENFKLDSDTSGNVFKKTGDNIFDKKNSVLLLPAQWPSPFVVLKVQATTVSTMA